MVDEESTTVAALYDFDEDFQTKIAALQLRDTVFAQRSDGLIDAAYFQNEAEAVLVRIGVDYYRRYKKAPDSALWGTLIRDAVVAKRVRKDMIEDIKAAVKGLRSVDISDRDFVLDQVAMFARHQAVANALMASVDLHAKKDFDAITKRMREAVDVGVAEDTGAYDFWNEVANRSAVRTEIAAGTFARDGITTGHPELDNCLYHRGWGRRELSVMMGAAKAGKSMSLGEFGKNASLAGFNVLYASYEVSTAIIADRIDAGLTDVMMRELTSKIFEVEEKVNKLRAKAGQLVLIEYPSGMMKPSQLRRILERYRARGVTFDLVIVDYADIMAPEFRTDNLQENSKSIYLDLRAIAFEYSCAVLTATQTNREGAKSTVATMTDVAEDFNKIRIADIVISINSTLEERAAGEARLFFAAVRNGEDGFTLRIKQDRSRMKFISKIMGRE